MLYNKDEQRQLFDLSKKLLQTRPMPIFPEDAMGEVKELIDVLIYHEWRYYVQNEPVVSDFEFDTLYKRLQAIEAEFPETISNDSPTQRVSKDLTDEFTAEPHLNPMLSLENSYNEADLLDFDEQVKKLCLIPAEQDVEYVVEPKFDGGTIVLVYENDTLLRGSTRGDGVMGEVITNNVKSMKTIPLKANFSNSNIQKVELRGEALIRKDIFEKVNEQRSKEGQPLLANPRNAATGVFKVKDSTEVKRRGLEAFIYQLGFAVDKEGNDVRKNFSTHYETIELLGKLGFKIPQNESKLCKNIQEVIEFCLAWQEKRDKYEYEIDGMVVKVNRLDLQERCGSTSHHPRSAVAFKFKARQATTKLLNIEFQVGKIGSITPVAKLEPVALAGVTVSSVSLHNEDFIKARDIRIGDTVLVERAGDVIPYIVKSLTDLRTGDEKPVEFPTFCPINKQENVPLVREEGEAAWRCVHCTCGAQNLQKMIFHVSKDGMDIQGLGESVVEKLYNLGWVKNIADIYRIDYEAFAKLDGFGERSAQNLKNAIEKAKKNPLQKLLPSLAVHHLGKKAGKLLAAEIENVFDLQDWTLEKYLSIKEIGPVLAQNATEYFQNPKNIEMLKEMEALGVNFNQTEEDRPMQVSEDAPLAGKTILFTGTLAKLGRKEAQTKAEKAGAKNISAVSSNLNILVVGEEAGSKLKKAQALGTVQILTEDEFLELIGD